MNFSQNKKQMNDFLTKKSKELSYLLRHNPSGLNMDEHGYVLVQELLRELNISFSELELIISENNKQRFSFDISKKMVRANQGHSIEVDVELEKKIPPKFLYHGTASRNVPSIRKTGLNKMNRLHVHLSSDYNTALNVAQRYCKNDTPHIFTIDTYPMIVDNVPFYLSKNGVWLVDHIDPKYLK